MISKQDQADKALEAAGLIPAEFLAKPKTGNSERYPPASFSFPANTVAPIRFPVSSAIRACFLLGLVRGIDGKPGLVVGGPEFPGIVDYVRKNCAGRGNWTSTRANTRSMFRIIHEKCGFGFRFDPVADRLYLLGVPADGFPGIALDGSKGSKGSK